MMVRTEATSFALACTMVCIVARVSYAEPRDVDKRLRLRPERIAKILLCFERAPTVREGGTGFNDIPTNNMANYAIEPYPYSIQNTNTIALLCRSLAATDPIKRAPPFSGILSYQVFLGRQGEVVAVTHIVLHECTVIMGTGARREESAIMLGESLQTGKNRDFCRIIYDMMQRELPDVIRDLDKQCEDRGGVEKMLFGEVSVRQ